MFRSHLRKILRDVSSRKGRTAMVSIAVFIGVLGVVTLLSAGDLLIRQLNEDLKKDELAMIRAFVSVPLGTELDNAAYLETLRQLPGVTEVQGNANYPISWKLPGDEKFAEGYIRTFSESFEEIPLEPPRLTVEGRYPTPGSKEVAIERRMATKYGLTVGDELVLRTLGGATDGSASESTIGEETWTIVGVLFHSYTYFGGAGGFIPNETSVYANYEDAQYIAGFTGFSSIYARYADFGTAEREADNFLTAIGDNSPYVVVFTFSEDPAENLFVSISQQYTGVISMLAVVAMAVSGFLVTNVISTIVLEQKRQIGVMKSLGATRWDNFMIYAGIALAYGLIGTVPGVLLGMPLGHQLAQVIAEFPNALIEEFSVSPLGVGMGIGMGLLVPVLAALVPVYNGTKVTVLEAMIDLGISTSYGAGRTARLIGALPLPINVRQALSNVIQKKGRLVLTVATLTFAVAAFMGVFAVLYSLNEVLGGIFEAYGYEIQVNPTDVRDFDEMREIVLDNVEDAQMVYPGVGFSVQVEGYVDQFMGTNQLQVLGIDPSTGTFALDLKEGTAWQDDPEREGIVLTSSVAEQLGKKAGDSLIVVAAGKTAELEIIGIDRFPFDQAFMEWRALARLARLTSGAAAPGGYTTEAQVEGYGVTPVVGLEVNEQMSSLIVAGSNLSGEAPEVIISAEMAEQGNYQVGDELTLAVGDASATYPIVGILELPPGMAPQGQPTDFVGIFWEELARLEGRGLDGEPAPNVLFVQLKNAEATSAEVDTSIEAISETMIERGIAATYANQVAAAEESAQQVMSMGVIFNMTAGVMAAVGAIGLLSTLSMSVFERQKEIGVMRSIGAGSFTVAGQFLVEGILVGVIAWGIGVPLSYVLGRGMLEMLPFGFIEFQYPQINLVMGLIGVLVIAIIASLWPSISAARKTVSEIIRYQ